MTTYESIPRALAQAPNPSGLCWCGCGEMTHQANRTDPRKNLVAGEYVRYKAGHHLRKSVAEYIEQDCGYETPCWVWQRALDGVGYGKIAIDGAFQGAHRIYYERFVGPIPDKLTLDHLCMVRACVNPAHLEPVTHGENIRRGYAAKRARA